MDILKIIIVVQFGIILAILGLKWKEFLANFKKEWFYEFIIFTESGIVKNPLIFVGRDSYEKKYQGVTYKCPSTKLLKNGCKTYFYKEGQGDPFDPVIKEYAKNTELDNRRERIKVMDLWLEDLSPLETIMKHLPAFIVGVVIGVGIEIIRNKGA